MESISLKHILFFVVLLVGLALWYAVLHSLIQRGKDGLVMEWIRPSHLLFFAALFACLMAVHSLAH